jgi:hypothetical protein
MELIFCHEDDDDVAVQLGELLELLRGNFLLLVLEEFALGAG